MISIQAVKGHKVRKSTDSASVESPKTRLTTIKAPVCRRYEITPITRKQVEGGLEKIQKILGTFETHVILSAEKRRHVGFNVFFNAAILVRAASPPWQV
jgi:hypothetical protein